MKKHFNFTLMIVALGAANFAHALKCTGKSNDCTFSVYTNLDKKLSVYKNNCQYSDDNGGGAEIVSSAIINDSTGQIIMSLKSHEVLIVSADKTSAVFHSENEKIKLLCE